MKLIFWLDLWCREQSNNIHQESLKFFIISPMTSWPVPSTYMDWKLKRFHVSCLMYLGHIHLAELVSLQVKPQLMCFNLKAYFGHRWMTIDSIEGTVHPGCWLQLKKPSTQWSWIVTALVASIALPGGCWLQESLCTLWKMLFWSWWVSHHFSHLKSMVQELVELPMTYVVGSTGLHGTSTIQKH